LVFTSIGFSDEDASLVDGHQLREGKEKLGAGQAPLQAAPQILRSAMSLVLQSSYYEM